MLPVLGLADFTGPKDVRWLENLGDYRGADFNYKAKLKSQAAALSRAVQGVIRADELDDALKRGQDFLEITFDKRCSKRFYSWGISSRSNNFFQ